MSHDVNHTPSRRAFTLVELSIVLVILGLLVGGVLAGKNLIRNAALNRIGRDLEQFESATNQFIEQYKGLPGDILNATVYWGSAGGTGDDLACQSNITNDTRTCNGNADKAIGYPTGANFYMRNEQFRAWQQLSNAGLISGKFTGVSANTSNFNGVSIGINSPSSQNDSKLGFTMLYYPGAGVFDVNYYVGSYGNMLYYASYVPNTWIFTPSPSMTPQEMFLLDTKRDDGNPTTGNIRSTKSTLSPGCTTDDTTAALYATTNADNMTCFLQYIMKTK